MVPGVTGLVVRRCRKITVLISLVPVHLAFQVPAMASGAMVLIEHLAKRHHGLILIEEFYLFGFRLMVRERPAAYE
jgi:hypothetical protein